jgi:hypothetical protein
MSPQNVCQAEKDTLVKQSPVYGFYINSHMYCLICKPMVLTNAISSQKDRTIQAKLF